MRFSEVHKQVRAGEMDAWLGCLWLKTSFGSARPFSLLNSSETLAKGTENLFSLFYKPGKPCVPWLLGKFQWFPMDRFCYLCSWFMGDVFQTVQAITKAKNFFLLWGFTVSAQWGEAHCAAPWTDLPAREKKVCLWFRSAQQLWYTRVCFHCISPSAIPRSLKPGASQAALALAPTLSRQQRHLCSSLCLLHFWRCYLLQIACFAYSCIFTY